jgi:hypothetical protein
MFNENIGEITENGKIIGETDVIVICSEVNQRILLPYKMNSALKTSEFSLKNNGYEANGKNEELNTGVTQTKVFEIKEQLNKLSTLNGLPMTTSLNEDFGFKMVTVSPPESKP